MNSVDNLLPWSLEYVPPSIDCLANCEIEYLNRNNIEDGLCCPDDQKLFLTASMSFLQNHLFQKLNANSTDKKTSPKRVYSDLLILENSPKLKQTKYYLKLKNINEYDEISKKEASFPACALTLNQILPQPKKCLGQHTIIFKLLRRFSNTKRLKDKSQSAYNLFKGNDYEPNYGNPSTSSSTWKAPGQTLKLPPADVCGNMCPSSSLAINRITMASNFIKPTQSKPVDRRYPNCANKNKLILFACQRERKVDEEITGTIHLDKNEFEVQEKNIFVKLFKDSKINALTRTGAQTRLRQQLQLKECVENKYEVSKINYGFVSTNFTDELKYKFSSDHLF